MCLVGVSHLETLTGLADATLDDIFFPFCLLKHALLAPSVTWLQIIPYHGPEPYNGITQPRMDPLLLAQASTELLSIAY